MRSIGLRFAFIMSLFVLAILARTDYARADALSDLNGAFREAYSGAAQKTLADLRTSVPVLVNRFGQIALYRPGIEQPDVFSMNMKQYLEARAVAHTAIALYVRIVPFGLGELDSERLDWLASYQVLLAAAATEVEQRDDIPEDVRTVQIEMLSEVRRMAQRIHQQGQADQEMFDELGANVVDAIRKNLAFAAASQLDQFRAQVDLWKSDNLSLDWENAVVVIIGNHQARDRYLQRQFFDWMLDDQPAKQNRVVFAETLTPPPALDKEPATDAMLLLSKVMLDKGAAATIFGDPLALQYDVLGDAAEAIIGDW